jgi:hypothetical protein
MDLLAAANLTHRRKTARPDKKRAKAGITIQLQPLDLALQLSTV